MKKLKMSLYIKGDKKNQSGETAIYGKIYSGNDYSTFSTLKYIFKRPLSKLITLGMQLGLTIRLA
jgi:hypothetical protein